MVTEEISLNATTRFPLVVPKMVFNRLLKTLICFVLLAVPLLLVAQGDESVPIYTWDRGLTLKPETLFQYCGFCSEPSCSKMNKPKSIDDAPFSVIPDPSIKKPFIIKTPFVEPHEKEGDIWRGMAAFVKQILGKQ